MASELVAIGHEMATIQMVIREASATAVVSDKLLRQRLREAVAAAGRLKKNLEYLIEPEN
jgi:hypothetical protein